MKSKEFIKEESKDTERPWYINRSGGIALDKIGKRTLEYLKNKFQQDNRTEYKGSGNPASAEIADLMHDTDADRFLRNLTGDSGQHFDPDDLERVEKELAQTQTNIANLEKQKDDIESQIANKQAQPKQEYIKSVRDLIALNPQIKNPNLIYPGQKINVGDGRTYTVQKGDNLTKISKMDHGPFIDTTDTDNTSPAQSYSGDNISANFAESSELDTIKKLSGIKR